MAPKPCYMESMRIESLKKYRGRNPNGYFQDLPWPIRQRAYRWLHYFCERARRQRGSVPQWLFAIYCGQAKRLAKHPPSYDWSRWMNAKKGGYAVQRRYRHEGRHPTAKATQVRLSRQRIQKQREARRTAEQQARRNVQALVNLARWNSR